MSNLSWRKPSPPDKHHIFLLNPHNQAVLDGETHRYSPRRRFSYTWIILFVFLVFIAALLEWQNLYLREIGQPILATVISRRTDTYTNKNGEQTDYLVTYEFVPPEDGKIHSHESFVGSDVYNQAVNNSHLEVIYDPRALDTSDTADNVMSFPVFTLLSLAVGIVGTVYYGLKWRSVVRLRNAGTLIKTSLDNFTAARGRGKRKSYYDVEFRFSFYALDGHSVSAIVKDTLTKKEFESRIAPEYGTTIAILYVNDDQYAML